jgi:hypothetical protein
MKPFAPARYTGWRCVLAAVKRFGAAYLDHLDGDKSNNRIENLRPCTSSQNSFHQKRSLRNTSGVVGVSLDIRPRKVPRWRAYISVHRRQIRLGCFEALEGALAARRAAEAEYYGGDPRTVVGHGE